MPNLNFTEQQIKHKLLMFYLAWIDWALNGAINTPPFNRHDGLCMALQCWTFDNEIDYQMHTDLQRYLKYDFRDAGLDRLYPFGEADWNVRGTNNTMHECPHRVAFVRSAIGKYKKEPA